MTQITDFDLYARGAATLLASWEEYARGSSGAALVRLRGVAAAVFPTERERSVYNNALLDRDLGATQRVTAVDAMEAAYLAGGIDRYAAWVHESDEGMRSELSARGYTLIGGAGLAVAVWLDRDQVGGACERLVRELRPVLLDGGRRLELDGRVLTELEASRERGDPHAAHRLRSFCASRRTGRSPRAGRRLRTQSCRPREAVVERSAARVAGRARGPR